MLRAEGMIPVEVSSAGSRTSIRTTGLCVGDAVVLGIEAFICCPMVGQSFVCLVGLV